MGLCNNKELTINGKEIRSPEQQVWKNMQDIDMLKSFIKPIYQTTAELTAESTGVLIADTNVPEGTKVGWILTEDGLFFQIEDSNETSLLLLFLADLKGPQGEDGTDGQDGQDGVTPSITATATVDSQVGTPSVSVTKTGTDEAPTFTFAFHNLKGETGTSLISVEVVAVLPASGDTGTLYFVPNSGSVPNQYDEYIWLNNAWEKLGTQSIDLSNYIQKSNTSGLVKNDGTIDTSQYLTALNSKVLLWTNSDPNNAFVPDDTYAGNPVKNVVLSQPISNFSYIIIGYKKYIGSAQPIIFTKMIIELNSEIYLDAPNSSSTENIIVARTGCVDASDETLLHFRRAYSNQQVDNNRCIPVYIYGTNIL